jgi:phosphoadenosine phosphosulfate reductase
MNFRAVKWDDEFSSAASPVREKFANLKQALAGAPPEELLAEVERHFEGKVVMASSLGLEDQVLTAMIALNHLTIPIVTMDTGRLFPETLDLIDRTEKRLEIKIQVFFPQSEAVQRMVALNGVNLFRENVELRQHCCAVRKLEPLKRALSGKDAWICGLRQGQGVTRQEVESVEWDSTWNLIKFNPLASWSESAVREYLEKHQVPYNPLHDAGFPSIGCACCTRAILPGEERRAGRWWWERAEQRECGLHRRPFTTSL